MTRVTKDLEGRRGMLTNGEQRITGKVLSMEGRWFGFAIDGGCRTSFPPDNWDFEPEAEPLPTEPGVYIPAGGEPENGPCVFVLYGGHWRSTPRTSYSAREQAEYWHENGGLVRLVPEGSAA